MLKKLKNIVTKIKPSLSNLAPLESSRQTSATHLDSSQRRATFLEQVPTILKKKNILLEPETYNTFMKHDRRKGATAAAAKIKTNPDVLERNQKLKDPTKKKKVTSSYRGFNPRGKMYVNELWSAKYYTNIISSSLLKEQDDELNRLTYKTTQEKLNEINNVYIKTRVGKETSSNKLFIKHQNEVKITQADLILQLDYDYDFASLKEPKKSARPKLSLPQTLNRSNTVARPSYFVTSPNNNQKQTHESYDFTCAVARATGEGTPSHHSKEREGDETKPAFSSTSSLLGIFPYNYSFRDISTIIRTKVRQIWHL